MMARIPMVDVKAATGSVKAAFEGPLKGKEFNIFKSMAASPAVLDVYLGMAGALGKAGLSLKEREVIQLAIGAANSCGYCEAAHTAIGKGAGLTEAQTVEARRGTMSDPKLNALTKFVLAIREKNGYVSDADFAAFTKAGYTPAHAGEAVATYAQAVFTNVFNHVNDTAVDFPAAPAI
jgi:AhpD family alkylhydroperoxidase